MRSDQMPGGDQIGEDVLGNVEDSYLAKAYELGERGYHIQHARAIVFNNPDVDLSGYDEELFRMYFYDGKTANYEHYY